MSGKLYIIPTPIGNLEDITLRAIRILKEVNSILCEDTRQTVKLLNHLGIQSKLIAFHKENEHQLLPKILERLKAGEIMGLVSDAGTPGISDPGFLISRACLAENIAIETLPGATAFVPAIINSGFPCNEFIFIGFLPHKKGRQTALINLSKETRTLILYESNHRLVKLLTELLQYLGDERLVSVSRELTKFFEENIRGTIPFVLNHFKLKDVKGECVVIISNNTN